MLPCILASKRFQLPRSVTAFGVIATAMAVLTLGLLPNDVAADVTADESAGANAALDSDFYETHIRPVLIQHCYECHSEQAGEQQGGLLLDRQSGWIDGGESNKAVVPGQPAASLLVTAMKYDDDALQMPPDGKLDDKTIGLIEQWVRGGAPGPKQDLGETEFSRLGDQEYIFDQAAQHWSFQPVVKPSPPSNQTVEWNDSPVDQFVLAKMITQGLRPSRRATPRDLYRRLSYALTGLPPTVSHSDAFVKSAASDRDDAMAQAVDHLIDSPEFGQHIARMWLDVARYADTDSAYRADTKTPHYFPFAFTYRDYVVNAFNGDKPYDRFLKEQFAADLLGVESDAAEMAALGFLGVAPHANRTPAEVLDDWIDVTTRGLLGLTVACARCHDHKYEPVPTVDYYSLRGIFNSLDRPDPLDEKRQPILASYRPTDSDRSDYQTQRDAIDAKIAASEGKTAKGNNRSVSQKIRETQLAQLMLFHPGAPARAMVVGEKKKRPASFVHIRGDARARGENAPPRFLKILDAQQIGFGNDDSGRLDLVTRIASADNPLTARVYVNRVWGWLIGSHLVDTPSDFGLQGSPASHPLLLDYLAADFVENGWSTKRLVRQIVLSQTFCQSSRASDAMEAIDPINHFLWRANRRHLSIEAIRDSVLAVSDQLDRSIGGRAAPLWPTDAKQAGNKQSDYTRRRTIYGYINRFNLDPTLRAFDFPSPMQTHPSRGESIVAPQALFLLNSPFVTDQMKALVTSEPFVSANNDDAKLAFLFDRFFQRTPHANEVVRMKRFIAFQERLRDVEKSARFDNDPWPLIAQSLVMSNEFQYVD